ncbi:MAG: GNAT family N-acetyltransferase [Clostridiaceae bacterium]
MFFNTDFLRDGEIYLKLVNTSSGNPEKGYVPAYHFNICNSKDENVGSCDLRIEHNRNTYYGGNIGYSVKPEYRGNHYAGKASRLLLELARMHNMGYVIITCSPENIASKKSIEYAGGILQKIMELPSDTDMYLLGDRNKCQYKIEL